ncbi:hypothetical protein HCA99_00260 [Listeria booriae]|uniref:hypothetical protein n=1 Tax=Listeria booriae TaxID=1552123 RepID=UPI001623FAED|nr:hypothetical protein [Listeria booriae]MBC2077639.1 hypothetical protein [Listeria booriae]
MLNGVIWFILGFMLATIYSNIFVSNKAKRKADEYYDITNLDDSDNNTVHSRRSRYH